MRKIRNSLLSRHITSSCSHAVVWEKERERQICDLGQSFNLIKRGYVNDFSKLNVLVNHLMTQKAKNCNRTTFKVMSANHFSTQ